MRVTFPRLPDHQRAYSLVERDDGVVQKLNGGVAGPGLPPDIVHLVVERELHIRDGIWGGIAEGVVFSSMRAELLADLVATTAALDDPTPSQIRELAAIKLAVLPDAEVDPAVIAAAARALQVEAARWARLRVGEHLDYDWPVRDTETTLTEFMRGYERATNSHDIELVSPLIAADATYWFTDGSYQGREAVARAIEATFASIQDEVYRISDLEWITCSHEQAVCRYRFAWTGRVAGERRSGAGRGTNVIVRRDGGWQMLHEHLST